MHHQYLHYMRDGRQNVFAVPIQSQLTGKYFACVYDTFYFFLYFSFSFTGSTFELTCVK